MKDFIDVIIKGREDLGSLRVVSHHRYGGGGVLAPTRNTAGGDPSCHLQSCTGGSNLGFSGISRTERERVLSVETSISDNVVFSRWHFGGSTSLVCVQSVSIFHGFVGITPWVRV